MTAFGWTWLVVVAVMAFSLGVVVGAVVGSGGFSTPDDDELDGLGRWEDGP